MIVGDRPGRLTPRKPGERLRTKTHAAFLAFWTERFRTLFAGMRPEAVLPDIDDEV